MGRIAGEVFDELFFREDPGNRGRPLGEVMGLLERGAVGGGHAPETIHLIRGEEEATATALAQAMPGDLIVITPTEVAHCWKQVTSFEPKRPAATSPPRLTVVA